MATAGFVCAIIGTALNVIGVICAISLLCAAETIVKSGINSGVFY